ncbi:hypothetical protein [Pantoea sp. Nvir]|uniref:hypothetical protein n=1 Tax=Pantoea sp. Nvir TaxID=2576760 RepID=UPI00135AC96E|nr:hypothetical protein [Pantoea sp. Nvir]MXP66627.1 hypothetical protein [Pantoea sp. Nvir]CAJ0992017.1 Lipid A 1-diphosphate synthase [Pantoea sp. Nvir]
MRTTRLVTILLLNAIGFALFLSWYLPPNHGFWASINKVIFFSFNNQIVHHPGFALLVAVTNCRVFDLISLFAMGIIYFFYWNRETLLGRQRILAIGIIMLLSALIINQLSHLLPVQHKSPTLFFKNAHRVSLLTGITTKDASSNSFPGDHGMMLMIFSCFMWRYFGFHTLFISASISVIFSLPRIMSGAHWFTDIAVGSLSVLLIGMSWILLTPLSDVLINTLCHKLLYKYK